MILEILPVCGRSGCVAVQAKSPGIALRCPHLVGGNARITEVATTYLSGSRQLQHVELPVHTSELSGGIYVVAAMGHELARSLLAHQLTT